VPINAANGSTSRPWPHGATLGSAYAWHRHGVVVLHVAAMRPISSNLSTSNNTLNQARLAAVLGNVPVEISNTLRYGAFCPYCSSGCALPASRQCGSGRRRIAARRTMRSNVSAASTPSMGSMRSSIGTMMLQVAARTAICPMLAIRSMRTQREVRAKSKHAEETAISQTPLLHML
jgi:hypothetical protein